MERSSGRESLLSFQVTEVVYLFSPEVRACDECGIALHDSSADIVKEAWSTWEDLKLVEAHLVRMQNFGTLKCRMSESEISGSWQSVGGDLQDHSRHIILMCVV
eukprot:50546-Hanusia_phi.AAC.3